MKIEKKNRKFKVGINNIVIKEVAKISLKQNEMVTFFNGKIEYDITKKNWGYYATPSINGRLKKEGFKTALVKNKLNKYYIMVVDKKKIKIFINYCKIENQKIIEWIDEKKN